MSADDCRYENQSTRWLTFLVYFLLTVLTAMAGWQQVQVSDINSRLRTLPKEYVSKERYLCDRADISDRLKTIDEKLDRLIRKIP
jgi:hypothetical protein